MFPRFVTHSQPLSALSRHIRRLVQRKLGRFLVGAVVLFTLGQGHALAATIHVTGACTLVDAITAANTDAVAGGCNGGSGADTIVLEAGSTHTLTVENNTTYEYGSTGLPVVTSEITIEGNGSTIRRDSGAPAFRLMVVGEAGNLTLQQITVTGGIIPLGMFPAGSGGGIANYGGIVTLSDCTVSGNSAARDGGGIANREGPFMLINSRVLGNVAARNGGGIANRESLTLTDSTVSGNMAASEGGGVYNSTSASLTLSNSVVSGNGAAYHGGGIRNYDGVLTLTDSTVSNNSAAYDGGGIDDYDGWVMLTNVTVSDNTAERFGGGLATFEGSFQLTNSTVSGNRAKATGGGIDNSEGGFRLTNCIVSGNVASSGGGIANGEGTITLTDSTVSGNVAAYGGGLSNGSYSSLTVSRSTVSANSAGSYGGGLANGGSLTLSNSTVSGNVAGNSGGGIALRGDDTTLEVIQSTISRNTAATRGGGIDNRIYSTAHLLRSLIAGNTAPTGPEVSNTHDAKITVNQFNLFGLNGDAGVAGFSPKPKDIVPAAGVMLGDILAPLADNSGPTLTHALVTGSPAIDAAGRDCPPPETDQRGVPRPQQTACDIGAFELPRGATEICDNCIDDDGNGQIDLLDNSCAAKSLTTLSGTLSLDPDPDEDKIRLQAKFSSVGVGLDPPTEGVTVSLVQAGSLLACVHIPAGEGWRAGKRGDNWRFREAKAGSLNDPDKDLASVQCSAERQTCVAKANVKNVQLGSVVAGEITTMIVIGDDNLIKTQLWDARAPGKRLITK